MNATSKLPPSLSVVLACGLLSLTAAGCETEGYEEVFDEVTRSGGPNVQKGQVEFGSFAAGTACETVAFDIPFAPNAGPLRAQVHVDHRDSSQATRDATTAWVRWLTADEIKICVRETSHSFENGDGGSHLDGLVLSYRVYRQDSITSPNRASGRQNGRSMTGDARDCGWVDFGTDFGVVPLVNATIFGANAADNTNNANVDDRGVSVWMEAIESDRAKICARSTAVDSQDSTVLNYAIDWYAYAPGYAPGSNSEQGEWLAEDADHDDDGWIGNGRQCYSQTFVESYTHIPDVFVSADHLTHGGHDAITTWIEDLDTTGFELCFRELATPGMPGANDDSAHRADLRLSWTSIEP